MQSTFKPIGKYIRLVDVRNKDLAVELLLGLTINKQFIPSVANTVGANMANYKVIKKGQFACSIMQVRRDKKMPVALLDDFDEAIISQAYPVFEVIDETELLPEYLMMWFSRSEFDREACFYAVGGVRGSLEWEDFCNMQLPVPSIEKQRAIVKEYNAVVNRIKLNEQLNQKLEEIAQALYKHWFVDDNEEYQEKIKLNSLVSTQYGYTEKAISEKIGPKFLRITDIAQSRIDWTNVPFCPISKNDFEKYKLNPGDIVVARTGATAGYGKRLHKNFPEAVFASFLVRLIPNNPEWSYFLGLTIDNQNYRDFIISNAQGSAQPQANAQLLTSLEISKPDFSRIMEFNRMVEPIFDTIERNQLENLKLDELREIVLSKMTQAELEQSQTEKEVVV